MYSNHTEVSCVSFTWLNAWHQRLSFICVWHIVELKTWVEGIDVAQKWSRAPFTRMLRAAAQRPLGQNSQNYFHHVTRDDLPQLSLHMYQSLHSFLNEGLKYKAIWGYEWVLTWILRTTAISQNFGPKFPQIVLWNTGPAVFFPSSGSLIHEVHT